MHEGKRGKIEKSSLSTAIAGLLLTSAAPILNAGTTIVFGDNITPIDPFPGANATQRSAFSSFNEFRVMTQTGATSGGGEKTLVGDSLISGAGKPTTLPHNFVTWEFNDNNQLESVVNSDKTPGAHYYAAGCGYVQGGCILNSAAPDGDVGLFRNAAFLGSPFGFLAPTVGSAAGTKYGVSSLVLSGSNITVRHPVAEAQWAEGYFTLGMSNGAGIVMSGSIEADKHTFRMTADHQISASEDSLGFSGQNTQWDVVGVVNSDPKRVSKSITTNNNTPIDIPLGTIATDREGDTMTITTPNPAVTGTAGGSVTCTTTPAGSCTYTPDGVNSGDANFTINVIDNFATAPGNADIKVTITVSGANSPPIAIDDSKTEVPSTVVDQNSTDNAIDIVNNDLVTNNPIDQNSINIVSGPTNGSIGPLPNDGSGTVLYTPNAGFSGVDSFTYTIDDVSSLTSNAATVTVTVNCTVDACAKDGMVVPGSLGSIRLTADDLIPGIVPFDNNEGGVGESCNPDCFDYTAPASSTAVVVLTLSGPIQTSSVYRKIKDGAWGSFDTSNGIDMINSTPGNLGSCPPAGDPDYSNGLAAGAFCLELIIDDGGPNDDDGVVNGSVTDPGGPGFGQPEAVTLNGESLGNSFGCSLSNNTSSSKALTKAVDLWLVGGLIGWLFIARKRRRNKYSCSRREDGIHKW